MKNTLSKFRLINFNKKIFAVLAAVLVMFSVFSVLSFAEDETQGIIRRISPDNTNASEQNVIDEKDNASFPVKIISAVDTQKGTEYVAGSVVKIYKVNSKSEFDKNYATESNYCGSITTDEKGEVTAHLAPGFYIFVEDNFSLDGKNYSAEVLGLKVTDNAAGFTGYIKHSVIQNKTPSTPTPFTGSNTAVVTVAFISLAAAMFVFVMAKKKENKTMAG